METKDVSVVETGLPAVSSGENLLSELGVEAKDLSIYKILLMQKTSEFVGDEKAAFGDLVHSRTAEKFGGFDQSIEVLPVQIYKTWVIYDVTEGTPKFVTTEDMTPANSSLPWEFSDAEGRNYRRDQCINVMVLLTSEVAAGEPFPYIMSFRRASFSTGKDIVTQVMRSRMFGKPIYAKTIQIGVGKQKKDTNTYAVFTSRVGRTANEAEAQAAQMWAGILKSSKVAVDNSDLEREDSSSKSSVAPSPKVMGGDEASKNDLY